MAVEEPAPVAVEEPSFEAMENPPPVLDGSFNLLGLPCPERAPANGVRALCNKRRVVWVESTVALAPRMPRNADLETRWQLGGSETVIVSVYLDGQSLWVTWSKCQDDAVDCDRSSGRAAVVWLPSLTDDQRRELLAQLGLPRSLPRSTAEWRSTLPARGAPLVGFDELGKPCGRRAGRLAKADGSHTYLRLVCGAKNTVSMALGFNADWPVIATEDVLADSQWTERNPYRSKWREREPSQLRLRVVLLRDVLLIHFDCGGCQFNLTVAKLTALTGEQARRLHEKLGLAGAVPTGVAGWRDAIGATTRLTPPRWPPDRR